MAATNQTSNYGLPQWLGSDKLERTDMNTAMADIDDNLNLVDNEVNSLKSRLSGSYAADLNSITSAFTTIRFDTNTLNAPAAIEGLAIHFAIGVYSVQFAFGLGGNTMYHRTKYSNWTAWKQVT